jgi:anti-anti-sigma factor
MNIMHKVEKSVLVLSLKGNLTSEIDVNELKKAIQNHVNPMTKRVVVDLERVDHISGLAISWLLGTRKLMEKYQGKLHLTSINSNVREITRTDLVKFFKIYPTVYEALKIK